MKEPKTITTGFSASNSDRVTSFPNVSFNAKSIAVVPAFKPSFLYESLVSAILGSQFLFRLSDNCSPSGSTSVVDGIILNCGDEEIVFVADSV